MATSFLAVDSAILTRFNNYFDEDGVTIVFPNEPVPTHTANKWVRATVLHGDGGQIALGPPVMHRRGGVVIFSVFTRPNIGFGEGMRTVDQITAIFQGASESSPVIRYFTPYLTVLGMEEAWYGLNLNIPFSWDATE